MSEIYEGAIAERNPLQNLFGKPRFIGIVKESRDNDDGTNEVEDFRKYFPGGEIYVDKGLSVYKALGDRKFTDGAFSKESNEFLAQRIEGMQTRKIDGNFRGDPETAMVAGGSLVLDKSGNVKFSHQEGVGAIDYNAIRAALAET